MVLEWSAELVTGPEVEPVTTSEARKQAQVVATDDDDLLGAMIAAAREMVEFHAQISLVTQTRRIRLDAWPCYPRADVIHLPYGPVQSISSIEYLDQTDATQTFSSANYSLDSGRSCVFIKRDVVLPVLSDERNAITITYVAGVAASAVPLAAKQAILMLVAHWYRNRETVVVGSINSQLEFAFQSLVQSLKRYRYPGAGVS